VSGASSTSLVSLANKDGNSAPMTPSSGRRQKSWDMLDQAALAQAKLHKQTPVQQVLSCFSYLIIK